MNAQQEVIGHKIIEAITSVLWHPKATSWGPNRYTGPKVRDAIPPDHRSVGEEFIKTQFKFMHTMLEERPPKETLWQEWREFVEKQKTRVCMVDICNAIVMHPDRICSLCKRKAERGEL